MRYFLHLLSLERICFVQWMRHVLTTILFVAIISTKIQKHIFVRFQEPLLLHLHSIQIGYDLEMKNFPGQTGPILCNRAIVQMASKSTKNARVERMIFLPCSNRGGK